MFNSKSDIFNSEWIEMVFENRNKSYGAYDLRKNYANNLIKAFTIAIFSLSAVIIGSALLFGRPAKTVSVNKGIDVSTKSYRVFKDAQQNKPNEVQQSVPKALQKPAVSAINHSTTQQQPVAPDAAQPASQVNTVNIQQTPVVPQQPVAASAVNDEDVDIKPLPVGGVEAWSDFLEKNLRYPAEAKQQRISATVQLNFIVERDGRITNINIDHPAGHGFDEEAIRVLNLSPKWTPGTQNGQTVRVKYSLPINFHIEHR